MRYPYKILMKGSTPLCATFRFISGFRLKGNKMSFNVEYKEGYNAFFTGINECPYWEGTIEYNEWFDGWYSAEDEKLDNDICEMEMM
jgi:ribosome modulation factor